jgi:hypothetical protein
MSNIYSRKVDERKPGFWSVEGGCLAGTPWDDFFFLLIWGEDGSVYTKRKHRFENCVLARNIKRGAC